jgi:DNA modification methylase
VIHHGDCVEVMAGMEPESVDAIVTDPPYGIELHGQKRGIASATSGHESRHAVAAERQYGKVAESGQRT